MKNYLYGISYGMLLIIFAAAMLISSCSKKDGAWDDNIKLSKKSETFTAAPDSTVFKTEGEGWWISNISLNEINIDFENINTTQNTYEIVNDEFLIKRTSKTEFQVKMYENTSLEIRILKIGIQAGNYFDGVTITQNGN